MLSGIGPAAHLAEHGINVVADRPGVGQNLQDHLELYIQMAPSQPTTLYKHWNLLSKAVIGAQWLFTKTGMGASNQFESAAYSSNPTYVDATGRVNAIELGQETTQQPFSFVTTIALHNTKGETMSVAKLSRPVEKNEEKDITFRVRLDF